MCFVRLQPSGDSGYIDAHGEHTFIPRTGTVVVNIISVARIYDPVLFLSLPISSETTLCDK